jgi:DNA-binding CsgD family transcriptional regulator
MEERAYRVLLAHRMATTAEVASKLSLSQRMTQRLLDSIESKGLASHSPERPRRYIAASPKLAVEALISQRQTIIDRARSVIPELTEQAMHPAYIHQREQNIELISGRVALGQVLAQLLQTVKGEIFAFQRPPMYFIHRDIPAGARARTISDAGYLALPGALDALQMVTRMGEEARIFPSLPVKMTVIDRRVGLLPLNAEDPNGPTLLVRECALIDTLCALFELTWEHATPIVFTRTGKLKTCKPDLRLSDAAEQIIPLLAAGLNDKAIAHQADISAATLNRRVAELMKCFGTRTRFQLGWRAALEAFPERIAANAQHKRASRSRGNETS